MKALSWKNPYGALMLHGKIETRTWNTKYRGKVLICTSKKPYDGGVVTNISGVGAYMLIHLELKHDSLLYHNGYAIAVGDLVDSRPMQPEDQNMSWVLYHKDLFCHVYENVKEIVPIPWKGSMGWREVPQDFIDKIVYK